jgi:hypothetical protein
VKLLALIYDQYQIVSQSGERAKWTYNTSLSKPKRKFRVIHFDLSWYAAVPREGVVLRKIWEDQY